MPATPTIIGALLGLGTQMYSNALHKLPYMRRIAPPPSLPALPIARSILRFVICLRIASRAPGAVRALDSA